MRANAKVVEVDAKQIVQEHVQVVAHHVEDNVSAVV